MAGRVSKVTGCVAAAVLAFGAVPVRAETITVFAAASLGTLFDALAPLWSETTGHDMTVSLGGSSLVARQIQLGAPADVVVLASTEWADHLDAAGLLAPGQRFDWLGNRLVLVTGAGAGAGAGGTGPGLLEVRGDVADRVGQNRLAMALVDSVPAGQYGRAALEAIGDWSAMSARIVEADNVRAALTWVASGAAAYGIVYATDAMADPDVTVAGVFPATTHPDIRYPAAAVAGGNPDLAAEFLAFLKSSPALAIAKDQGFLVIGG